MEPARAEVSRDRVDSPARAGRRTRAVPEAAERERPGPAAQQGGEVRPAAAECRRAAAPGLEARGLEERPPRVVAPVTGRAEARVERRGAAGRPALLDRRAAATFA